MFQRSGPMSQLIFMSSGLLLLAGACATGQGQVPESAEWDGCAEIRQNLDPQAANLTFSDPDLESPDGLETWPLSISGLSIQIPRGDYELMVSPDESAGLVVILVSDDVHFVITGWEDAPIEDIWLRSTFGPANEQQRLAMEQTTEERREATRELFDGYPTHHGLSLIAYEHTLQDLSCAAEEEHREVPIAMALILNSQQLHAVHHDYYGSDEITYVQRSVDEDSWSWSVRIPGELTREVAVRAADQETLRHIGAALMAESDEGSTSEEDLPGWLPLLVAAAQNPTDRTAWQTLEQWLEENGASERSLNSVRSFLE